MPRFIPAPAQWRAPDVLLSDLAPNGAFWMCAWRFAAPRAGLSFFVQA